MSLTNFIELSDVKERLRLDITKPWFQVHEPIKAPPLTTSYGWTGTAFDYLLRFYVEKLNPFAKCSPWIAEHSLALLQLGCKDRSAVKRARDIVATAKEQHSSYLNIKRDEKPGQKLIRAAIDLAQLDLVFRIGLLDLRPIGSAMVKDLSNLVALLRADDFRAKRSCLLNPIFGSASVLVGGADADLFIDGTLIDIKTTKHLEMGRISSISLWATTVCPASAASKDVEARRRRLPCTTPVTACCIGFLSVPLWIATAFQSCLSGSRRGRGKSFRKVPRSRSLWPSSRLEEVVTAKRSFAPQVLPRETGHEAPRRSH